MSAIAYAEEAFAILRANLKAEIDGIRNEHTALMRILNDPTSNRQAALDQAGVLYTAINAVADHYEPTVDQARVAGKPSHPLTQKPAMPEPVVVVEKPKPVKAKVEKKK